MPQKILIRRGTGAPANGLLDDSELAVDLTPNAEKLYVGRANVARLLGLPISGGTLTGPLSLSGLPTAADHAASKAYVDAAAPAGGPFVPIAGGYMTGGLTLGTTTSGTVPPNATGYLTFNTAANQYKQVRFISDGFNRWAFGTDNTVNNFAFTRYANDDGTGGATMLNFRRSDGFITTPFYVDNTIQSIGTNQIFAGNGAQFIRLRPVGAAGIVDVVGEGSLTDVTLRLIAKGAGTVHFQSKPTLAGAWQTPTLPTDVASKAYVDANIFPANPNNAFLYGRLGTAWSRAASFTEVNSDTNFNLNTISQPNTGYFGWHRIVNQGAGRLNWPTGVDTAVVFSGYHSNAGWPVQQLMALNGLYYRAVVDGTNWSAWQQVITSTGGTMTGNLSLIVPTLPAHAARKADVDAVITSLGNYVAKAGDTMSGGLGFGGAVGASNNDTSRHITLHTSGYGIGVTSFRLNYNVTGGTHFFRTNNADRVQIADGGIAMQAGTDVLLAAGPSVPMHATTRQYVDDRTIGFPFVPIAGGTMGGALITLPPRASPGGDGDATNKAYVDTMIANLRLFRGTWQVAANVPALPQPESAGDYYIAVTADNLVPERPPAGIPGLPPATTLIHNGDIVIWDEVSSTYELIQGGPLTYADAEGLFVNKSGDIMSGGLSFGSTSAADPSNLSRHISLFGAGNGTYGFTVSTNRLNIVNVNAADRVVFVNGAVDIAHVSSVGITLLNNRDVILARDPQAAMQAATRQYVDDRAWQANPNNAFSYGRVGTAWARVPALTFKLADTSWNLNTIPTDFIGWYQIAAQTTPVNFPPGNIGNYGLVFNGYNANANWRNQIFLGAANTTTDIAPIWIRGGTGAGAFNAWTRIITAAGGLGSTFTGSVTLSGPPTLALHAATKQYVDDRPTLVDGISIIGTGITGGPLTANIIDGGSY